MSKAAKLGGGASFAAAAEADTGGLSARGRAKGIAEGRLPAYSLVRLSSADVSPTPLNPRENFGTPGELTEFGEELRNAQLAACVVVTRAAYLDLWADHADEIGAAQYVLVNGERRWRAARQVELDKLDFVIRDEFAESREVFLEKLLSENLDRKDFDPIERARGVQQLVDACSETREHGAQARAARQLHKSSAWVTQQLNILNLPAEIRRMVSAGKIPTRDASWLGAQYKDAPDLTAQELLTLLEQNKAAEARKKEDQKAILRAAGQSAAPIPSQRLAKPSTPAAAPDTVSVPPESALGTFNAVSVAPVSEPPSPVRSTTGQDTLDLRRRLGATSKEQAGRIASILSPEELIALVEELAALI
ncbi:ParB/RepB/Spo0J family partition protein [Streptomyces sp. NPDC097981]|uniref:ParB/RepB/Spo0J family partition protein n=1 Tax=Streptomyces sp. NPDC097981 TaxID=3155428 RepID=UPI00331C6710